MPEAPAVSTQAPRFELSTHTGETWSLDDHVGADRCRPVVVVFHRHIH